MHSTSAVIVSVDHPSLEDEVWQFAEEVRNEQRFFGTTATPKPRRWLVNRLISAGSPRFAALVDGQIVGMCRVEPDGITCIVVLAAFRRTGVGRRLVDAAVDHAAAHGPDALVLQSSRHSRAVSALARSIGGSIVDRGLGRIQITIPTRSVARTA